MSGPITVPFHVRSSKLVDVPCNVGGHTQKHSGKNVCGPDRVCAGLALLLPDVGVEFSAPSQPWFGGQQIEIARRRLGQFESLKQLESGNVPELHLSGHQ